MNVSIHISGLILFLAGVLFLVSALISRQVYLYAVGAVCLICGLIWMWPRRKKKKGPKESGAGRYLS